MTLGEAAKACGGNLYLQTAEACRSNLHLQAGEGFAPHEAACTKQLQGIVDADTEFCGGVTDSRRIEPGCLFFAVSGQRVDGHSFIRSAYEKGAVCSIVSKTPTQVESAYGISSEQWGAYLLVEDVLQALKDIAEAYRRTLSIPVIGVTGSVGKTSTKEWIASVLSEKMDVLKTEGNFNNEIGLPLTLLRIRPTHQAAVVEMGISDFGEMERLSKMARPDICVITNIGQCHLENLKDRDGVLQAKSEIFTYMNPNGWVCLNAEDDKLRTIETINGKSPLFFGIEKETKDSQPTEVSEETSVETSVEVSEEKSVEKAAYLSNCVSRGLLGSNALLHIRTSLGEESIPVELPLPGEHMLLNAAAAACVAHLLGLTGEQIRLGLRKVQPVEGRSHLLQIGSCVLIDDCYNANPVSMKAALRLLGLADTPKAAILGDMLELGTDSAAMHREVGAYAAGLDISNLFFIGQEAHHMYQAALEQAKTIAYFPNKEAFTQFWRETGKGICQGYTILLKASHGMGFAELKESMFSDSENKYPQ
jgi:UDP-N-acetylmuramoyl-tripeptide--D-alanyl-D-alanine ligase